MEAMKKLTAPKARVLREKKELIVPAREVVPGDILILEAGDRLPADARLIEIVDLKTDEAVLTGESTPVKKELTVLKEDTPISERKKHGLFSNPHYLRKRKGNRRCNWNEY
jgi:Ca2+-transporting ATPase